MLKQRIITALILLLFLLPALFHHDTLYWRLIALVLIAAGAWEWGRLNGLGPYGSVLGGFGALVACVMAWDLGLLDRRLTLLWTLAGGAWVLAGAALLKAGVARWGELPRALRLVGGWSALWLTWLAVVQAREIGITFLLSVLLLVWMADVAAYFAGKALGGRYSRGKLAPAISPGKSWEGVWAAWSACSCWPSSGWRWSARACYRRPASTVTCSCRRAGGCCCRPFFSSRP